MSSGASDVGRLGVGAVSTCHLYYHLCPYHFLPSTLRTIPDMGDGRRGVGVGFSTTTTLFVAGMLQYFHSTVFVAP